MADIPTFEEWWDKQWKRGNFKPGDLDIGKIFACHAWRAAFKYATAELKRLNEIRKQKGGDHRNAV